MLDAAVDGARVAVDADHDAVVHGDGEGLGAAHPAEAGGEGDGPGGTLAGSAPVLIALSGEEKPTRKGTLDFVDNRVDNQTGTMLLRATVENPDRFIKPGLFGIVSMPATKPFKGIMIPDEAVSANQDKRIVYVLGEGDKVAAKTVKLGPIVDGYRVVRDGVKADDLVVVNGVAKIRPGAQVKPETVELPPTKK